MTRPFLLIVLLLASGIPLEGQAPRAAPSPTATPPTDDEQIVRTWVSRWNALGGGSASAIDDLLALYAPDALHITGPSRNSAAQATYRGHDGIRVLASRIAATQERLTYRIETETANEQTASACTSRRGRGRAPPSRSSSSLSCPSRRRPRRWVVPAAASSSSPSGKIRRRASTTPTARALKSSPSRAPPSRVESRIAEDEQATEAQRHGENSSKEATKQEATDLVMAYASGYAHLIR